MIKQDKKYYGHQTNLAISNFAFSIHPAQKELIYGIVIIKKAAAMANYIAESLPLKIKNAITEACDQILSGTFDEQFVTPALQGGAGTSINMNVNEVIAGLATEILANKGEQIKVHPNDHVNYSQSTNDVNPSGLKIASVQLIKEVIQSVEAIEVLFLEKSFEWSDVLKLGRTHLQDAVPTTLGAEFASYASIMQRRKKHLLALLPYFYELNLGGTAIGNSINASEKYIVAVYTSLHSLTKIPVKKSLNLMSQTGSQTDFVMLSQALVLLTLDLSKIASDIRLLSSGPNGGLGEITLENLQAGSSIMPGKVNPVLPESVNQLYFLVSGNNLTIEQAAHGAQLELGVMFPILADRLITSLKLTTEITDNFRKKCISGIRPNPEQCKSHLEKSTAYATLLTPVLGYDKVSDAVKKAIAQKKTLRKVILENGYMDESTFDTLVTPER